MELHAAALGLLHQIVGEGLSLGVGGGERAGARDVLIGLQAAVLGGGRLILLGKDGDRQLLTPLRTPSERVQ